MKKTAKQHTCCMICLHELCNYTCPNTHGLSPCHHHLDLGGQALLQPILVLSDLICSCAVSCIHMQHSGLTPWNTLWYLC